MSTGRTFSIGLAALAGYLVGAVAGFYIVLAKVDWSAPFEPELVIAVVLLGTLLAVCAGVLAAPGREQTWQPMSLGAAAVGSVAVVVLLVGELGPAFVVGAGVLEAAVIAAAARMSI